MSEHRLIRPLDSVELPSDRNVVRTRDLAARAWGMPPGGPTLHVAGALGSMPALVARALAMADRRPVICLTADLDAARRLADDLTFVWARPSSTEPDEESADGNDVLLYTPYEASPYADTSPD